MPALTIFTLILALMLPSAALAEPPEVDVEHIDFTGPAQKPGAQISGLAWHGDRLVMLPQYPDRVAPEEPPSLYSITRGEIESFLDGDLIRPIAPEPIVFNDGGSAALVPGFQGYESIAFRGDRAYLTIEAMAENGTMSSWVVSGQMRRGGNALLLEQRTLAKIPLPAQIKNMGHEALAVGHGELLAIFEAGGQNVNPEPEAFQLLPDLSSGMAVAAPSVEYRLTDATSVAEDGTFYVLNYYYPGDKKLLSPGRDDLPYGSDPEGERHVERVLKFKAGRDGIELQGVALGFSLTETPRNWEGIARLPGRGFLVATDQHPETILGFVPFRE